MTTNTLHLKLNELDVEVVKKNIKNVHLSVYPPNGRVKVSAPNSMKMDTLRSFVISKLGWIKKQQSKLRAKDWETPREFVNRESHYFNGECYLLKVIEREASPKIELKPKLLELHIRPWTTVNKRRAILNEWYRQQLKIKIPPLINKYEKLMGLKVKDFGVKKMKTRWGTCNTRTKRIWINLELAKKSPSCLEYIVVHEMAHLIEPSHNSNFMAQMDNFMPDWRFCRDALNKAPMGCNLWEY